LSNPAEPGQANKQSSKVRKSQHGPQQQLQYPAARFNPNVGCVYQHLVTADIAWQFQPTLMVSMPV
jgi:hypothetical protein